MKERTDSAFHFDKARAEPLVETAALRDGKVPSNDQETRPPVQVSAARDGIRLWLPKISGNNLVRKTARLLTVAGLDFLALGATLVMSLTAIADIGFAGQPEKAALFVAFFACATTAIFVQLGLYRLSWRFVRFADCMSMSRSVAAALIVAWIASLLLFPTIPRNSSILPLVILHGLAVVSVMAGLRGVRRMLRERDHPRAKASADPEFEKMRYVIVLGSPDWACTVIELVHSDRASGTKVVGILLTSESETIGKLCAVPVLGGPEMLASAVAILQARDIAPSDLILSDRKYWPNVQARAKIIDRAKMLGLKVGLVSDPWNQLLSADPGAKIKSLSTAQLLGREEYSTDQLLVEHFVRNRRVLVTGAGGTIGSELARQLASFGPAELTLLDHSEHDLYEIDMEIRKKFPQTRVRQALCCIRERDELREVFNEAEPELVFHAAALKHVPIVEANPCAGVHTNVLGTQNVAQLVSEFSCKAMVQVSTDKAVNPVGMMGATKRVGEIYCQALDMCGVDDNDAPRFITVRFGNVLGSSGSIVPLFKQQIAEGRELTVTHPDITRYFMTVGEAVQLILQSSAHAVAKQTVRGNIYVLDMGEPVKIYDLAQQMIRLAGLEPEIDIGIRFVGLRPGEKLYEELFDSCEVHVDSRIPGIFEARSLALPLPLIDQALSHLEGLVRDRNSDEIRRVLSNLVRIPSGTAAIDMPFGHYTTLMADYARGNFTVVQSTGLSLR